MLLIHTLPFYRSLRLKTPSGAGTVRKLSRKLYQDLDKRKPLYEIIVSHNLPFYIQEVVIFKT